MRRFACIIAALIATPALADKAPQATAAPAVASATSDVAAPSVADQIAAFLQTSPAVQLDDEGVSGVTPRDDRKVHGEVAVGVGTGGRRSLYLRSDMPVGETGRISIAIEDARYGRGYVPAHGLAAAAVQGAWRDPQGCGVEGLAPHRPLAASGGPDRSCAAGPDRFGPRRRP